MSYVEIDGVVGEIDDDVDWYVMFIAWLEENGWLFCGIVSDAYKGDDDD